MTKQEMKAKLEKLMLEEFDGCFYLNVGDEDDPDPWVVLIGDPHGCVPVEILGDEIERDIWKKFACYIRPVRALAAEILKIPYWDISMVIEPSYEDYTACVLYHMESMKVLLEVICKAWHFHWDSKEELLEEAYKDVIKVIDAYADYSPNVWRICEEDVQCVAEDEVGRRLNSLELRYARKCIESGLGDCWYSYVQIAVDLAVKYATEENKAG